MQDYDDMISFVYSDNGTYFFQRLYKEVERIQKKDLPLTGSHYIEELEMSFQEALDLAVSAIFAIQDEFMGKDHHGDYDAWRRKHPQEEMDYQTWINRSLIYQLDELKLTDISAALNGMSGIKRTDAAGTTAPGPEKKKKKRGFLGHGGHFFGSAGRR